MNIVFCIFFGLTISLFGLNNYCEKAASREKSENVDKPAAENSLKSAVVETNSKYKVSLLFEDAGEAGTGFVKVRLRRDADAKEFELFTIERANLPEDARRFWSPDEESIVFFNNQLTVYRTSELVKFLGRADFSFDDFLQKAKPIGTIEMLSDKQNPEFRHTFAGWHDKNSFSFEISRTERTDRAKFTRLGNFRYDFAQRRLYRQIEKSPVNSSTEEKRRYALLSSLVGKDSKGIIKASEIKDEIVQRKTSD